MPPPMPYITYVDSPWCVRRFALAGSEHKHGDSLTSLSTRFVPITKYRLSEQCPIVPH